MLKKILVACMLLCATLPIFSEDDNSIIEMSQDENSQELMILNPADEDAIDNESLLEMLKAFDNFEITLYSTDDDEYTEELVSDLLEMGIEEDSIVFEFLEDLQEVE